MKTNEEIREYTFDYEGNDGKTYPGKFIMTDGTLDSFAYYDNEEWIECDRGDVSKEEVSEAWGKGTELLEDEELEEVEKEIVSLEKFVKIASEFDNESYYTDKGWTIPEGTGPSDEAYGKALMQDYLDGDCDTFQEWEKDLNTSLTDENKYYDMWEELFTL